jgi:uncharacterized protein involved in response to NO
MPGGRLMRKPGREALPEAWRLAFERDRRGEFDHADPAPERGSGRVLAAFIATGLVFLAFPGTLLGVWNLTSIAAGRTLTAVSAAWIQAHGFAQVFGWVGTFIVGISLYALPKFQHRSLRRFGRLWACWILWTAGVTWRWASTVYGWHWRIALVGSSVLLLLAYALMQWVIVSPGRERPAGRPAVPQDLGSWLGIAGFSGLGIALADHSVLAVTLSRHSAYPVIPPVPDRVFWLVALWGFVIPVAWGYSTRFVTIFLGLRPPRNGHAGILCAGIGGIILLAFLRRFRLAAVLAFGLVLVAIRALRVFEPSERPPKRLGVYRHYPAFVRAAFGWLVVGSALGVLAEWLPAMPGLPGAGRHAITVGFIATLIFAIGPRILPAFLNGRRLASPAAMGISLWLLMLGCTLRVASESLAYGFQNGAWKWLPVSAFIELAAVLVFAGNLMKTLLSPVPAWFEATSVRPDLPLYFYLASFPETRRVLLAAGLKTLARAREVPRSLTVAEAAAADGVPVELVLEHLRAFFASRQPQRERPQTA